MCKWPWGSDGQGLEGLWASHSVPLHGARSWRHGVLAGSRPLSLCPKGVRASPTASHALVETVLYRSLTVLRQVSTDLALFSRHSAHVMI